MPPLGQRVEILATFHDDIGNWYVGSTRKFITEMVGWPGAYRDVTDYVKA